MGSFRDSKNNVWEVVVNVSTLKRIRNLLVLDGKPLDLLEAADGKLLERMLKDPVLLVDTIYVICKPQADMKGITDEGFGELLVGDAIQDATVALIEAIADFFPQDRRRIIRAVLSKVLAIQTQGLAKVQALIESPQFQAKIQQSMDKAFEQLAISSGIALESSASTPGPSR